MGREHRASRVDEAARVTTWRRFHGALIVAHVQSIPGEMTWEASAWQEDQPFRVRRDGCAYARLTDAHAAADALVRTNFRHACGVASCGQWRLWSEDRESAQPPVERPRQD